METKAIEDIRAERQRQIDKEDWTLEHDDQHADGSLAAAAACYANPLKFSITGDGLLVEELDDIDMPLGWPSSWDWDWWKPGEHRRNLVKAGALILAEIERLDRLPQPEGTPDE